MQAVSVNAVYFVLCASLYFQGGRLPDASSLCLFGLQVVLLVSVLVFFFLDPHYFDYFRYSFKLEQRALVHYLVELGCVLLVAVLVCALPGLSFIGALPCLALLVYTAITRPYLYPRDNWRSLFNTFTILIFISIKVASQYLTGNIVLTSLILMAGLLCLLLV